MATADRTTVAELEQMAQRARDHREHGDIPQNEWHNMARAAEAAFALSRSPFGGNDPAAHAADKVLDREQLAAMGLAREMAVSAAQDRANPFQADELRRAFDSERAFARAHDTGYQADKSHDAAYGDRRGDLGVSAPEWNRAVQNAELAIEARHMSDPRAADPVMQMGMQIPAGLQSRAYEVADQLAHSEDVDAHRQRDIERAVPGQSYAGRVVDVSGQYVFQQIGDRTIAHDRQALTGRAFPNHEDMRGQNVEIRYPHGRVGLVREAGQAHEKAGPDKAMQKDFGSRER